MGRLLAIDYGTVRVGVAVTDPQQIIATGLDTVPAGQIFNFLESFIAKEQVDGIVVGEPLDLNNTPAGNAVPTQLFIKKLAKQFSSLPIYRVDERFTSRMAARALIEGGVKKMKRRNKALIDKISATIILQTFLEMKKNKAGRTGNMS